MEEIIYPLGIDFGSKSWLRTFLVYSFICSSNSYLSCPVEYLLGPEDAGEALVAILEGKLDKKQIIQMSKKISGSEKSVWKRKKNLTESSGEMIWVGGFVLWGWPKASRRRWQTRWDLSAMKEPTTRIKRKSSLTRKWWGALEWLIDSLIG